MELQTYTSIACTTGIVYAKSYAVFGIVLLILWLIACISILYIKLQRKLKAFICVTLYNK